MYVRSTQKRNKFVFLLACFYIYLLLCLRVEDHKKLGKDGLPHALENPFTHAYLSVEPSQKTGLSRVTYSTPACTGFSVCAPRWPAMPAPGQLHLENWRAALAWLRAWVNISCLSGGLISSSKAQRGKPWARWMTSGHSPSFPHPQVLRHMPITWCRCWCVGCVSEEGLWLPQETDQQGFALIAPKHLAFRLGPAHIWTWKKMAGLRLWARHCPAGLSRASEP